MGALFRHGHHDAGLVAPGVIAEEPLLFPRDAVESPSHL
jgi:hypothetical protein